IDWEIDPLSRWQSALRLIPLLQLPKKSKVSRPQSVVSHRHSTVKTPRCMPSSPSSFMMIEFI
ncbi:unnamed protein product, partial [Caretta caretta]